MSLPNIHIRHLCSLCIKWRQTRADSAECRCQSDGSLLTVCRAITDSLGGFHKYRNQRQQTVWCYCLLGRLTLRKEAENSYETLHLLHQTTRSHTPEDSSVHHHLTAVNRLLQDRCAGLSNPVCGTSGPSCSPEVDGIRSFETSTAPTKRRSSASSATLWKLHMSIPLTERQHTDSISTYRTLHNAI